jgi:hypothetical protein
MGERCNRTAEVRGSIPLSSTTPADPASHLSLNAANACGSAVIAFVTAALRIHIAACAALQQVASEVRMFSLIALYFEYRKLKAQPTAPATTAGHAANDADAAGALQRAA